MYQRYFHILNIKLDIFLYCIFILNESRWKIIKYRSNYYYNREQIERAFSKEKFHPIRSMKSQRDWKFEESEKKKEGRKGNRGVSIDRVIPIDRSINREILHERNEGEKRKSKECFAYSIKRREYPQTLATWRVHDGQGDHSSHYHHLHALEIMPNIRTSRHSTHYEFIREGRKGESLLFLPGIDTLFRGERNNFWLKNDGWNWLEESRKRIAFPLVLWLSYLSPFLQKWRKIIVSLVVTFKYF